MFRFFISNLTAVLSVWIKKIIEIKKVRFGIRIKTRNKNNCTNYLFNGY